MKPTNTLFLFSDEHDPRLMGCSGHPLVKTPNLDALAARGTRFTNAYTPSPICVPARASLATGRYAHEIGYWENAIAYDGRVEGWGHAYQRAGMRVESIGKLHYRNEEDPTGFTRQHIPVHILDGIGQVWGSVRDPLPAKRPGRSPLFNELGPGESPYNRYDLDVTQRAIDWLEERARQPDSKPWLLFVGLVAPHMPYVVPQRYVDLYPVNSLPLPKLMPRDGHPRHPWVERMVRHWDHDETLGTDDRRRLVIASYMGLLTFLDENVGRLLEVLERTGLMERTRVIYSSDHGDNLGARGMWNKCTLYRESAGVPMIMAGSDVPQGRVCTTNVNLVDLAPTFLEAAGLETGAERKAPAARSLLRIAAERDDPDRLGFSEYHAVGSPSGGFMLTRGKFKYHYYVGYRPELFDLEDDPEETLDLALDPGYRSVLMEFERELRAMLDPEAVDRKAKDAQNAYVAQFGGPERAAKIGTPGATPMPEKFH